MNVKHVSIDAIISRKASFPNIHKIVEVKSIINDALGLIKD